MEKFVMKSSIDSKFKETEIGLIPEDWEISQIKDICVQVRKSFNPNDNDIRPYIGLEHINEDSLTLNGVGSSSNVKSGKFVFNKGQILFGKLRPYFRKVYRPDFDGVCSTDIIVIDKKDNFDSAFLFYFFANPVIIDIATQSSEGTRMPRASWSYLSDLEFAFPPLPEQKVIGKFLSSLDQKIALNNQMNQTLEAISQAIFHRWFVHFEFPDENGLHYKSSGGEMVDSELGEIPIGWKIVQLRDLVSYYIGGGWGNEDKVKDFEIESFVIRGTDIPKLTFGDINSCPKRYHKESNYKSRKIEPMDIVFEISGGSKGQPVGRSILIDEELVKNFGSVICASFCKLIRPDSNIISPYFIDHYFKSMYKSGEITEYQLQSTGITNFNFEYFMNKLVALPDSSINNSFHQLINPIQTQKSKLGHQNSILSQIRDSLLPKLMSGKIRVMEATAK